MKTGLILEGGAVRGIYTAGVLDAFMDHQITFDGVIGVSAGAIHGCSYVSGQRGRSIRYYKKYLHHPEFMSLRSLLKTGSLVGSHFCYQELPQKLDPFDYQTFIDSPAVFYAVCTNLDTGKAEYISMEDGLRLDYLEASASMPMVSKIVEIDGQKYLDGGVADSIPLEAAFHLGYDKNVLILTRPGDYRKKHSSQFLMKRFYRDYPAFVKTMENRADAYNQTLEQIDRLEKEGKILVIRPASDLHVKRMEKNLKKVQAAYDTGYHDGAQAAEKIKEFLR